MSKWKSKNTVNEYVQATNVMLVSITLTAATVPVCTACACTKRLNETQWLETWDETYLAETKTYCSKTEMRPEMYRSETRPIHWGFCPSRDLDKTLVRLEIVSRPRHLDRDHIPAKYQIYVLPVSVVFFLLWNTCQVLVVEGCVVLSMILSWSC